MPELDHSQDYVWHFKLPQGAAAEGEADALTKMVQEQVAALLRCVTFTRNGSSVRVTGFRFLDRPDIDHPIDSALPDTSPERSAGSQE